MQYEQMPRQSKSGGKGKRVRTIFTPEQLKHLESFFKHGMYLSAYTREQVANTLGLTQNQVKVWFQNRRIKERKMNPPIFMDKQRQQEQEQQNQQQQQQQQLHQLHQLQQQLQQQQQPSMA